MSIFKAYIDGLKKWKRWDGRTRRRDYWYYMIVHYFIAAVLYSSSFVLDYTKHNGLIPVSLFLLFAYAVLSFAPTLAITFRRLHDTNKGCLYILVQLTPCIGNLWFFILMASKGDYGRNDFGPDPKDQFSEDESVVYGDYPDFRS